MNIKMISDELAVSGQITPSDLQTILAEGFKSIVCHRPDAESEGQPEFADIQSAAEALGLEAHYQAIENASLAPDHADDFKALMATLPKPVLAYCRTGTRCTIAWAFTEAANTPTEDILAKGQALGIPLDAFADRLKSVDASKG